MADDYEIVAAIDFGTTYSGYAYCSKSDFKRSPPVIKTSAWKSGTGTCDKFMKTPTVVLFDQNQKFDSFGFEAEKKYLKLALRNQQESWYFFKKFKMRLHQRETEVSLLIIKILTRCVFTAYMLIHVPQLSIVRKFEGAENQMKNMTAIPTIEYSNCMLAV